MVLLIQHGPKKSSPDLKDVDDQIFMLKYFQTFPVLYSGRPDLYKQLPGLGYVMFETAKLCQFIILRKKK